VNQLDATFTALADPTRRAIVARLAHGDATVNELAAPFDMTLPGISKHLKVLERCGLISRTRHAQFRPCHLERQALDAAMTWIEENRRIWTERFDKLDAHLRDIQQAAPPGGTGAPGSDPGPGRPPGDGAAPPRWSRPAETELPAEAEPPAGTGPPAETERRGP
jgi:DNA-binding transcriptional ArsR family regulator